MALARSFISRRFHSLLLHPQNHLCLYHIVHSSTPHPHQTPPFHHRFIASSPQTVDLSDPESERKESKKPLHALFKGPVGVPEKTENSECEGKDKFGLEIKKLQKNLKQLESEMSRWTGKLKQEGECRNDPDNKEVKRKLKGKLKRSKAKSKEKEGVEKGAIPKKAEAKRLYILFSDRNVHVIKGKEVKFKQVILKKDKWKKAKPTTLSKEIAPVEKGAIPKKAEAKGLHNVFSDQNVHVNKCKEVKLKQPVVLKKDKSKKAKPTTLSKEIAPVEMHKEVKQREPVVLKELSPDMKIFVHHLYKEGYFNYANFAKGERFDLSWFDFEYGRNYILFAAQKFGKDKQEISKWLSGSDLKQVATFGCPSFNRALVIPSKRLRNFFNIPENTVCSKCTLRESCKFVNQNVWGCDTNKLDLAVTMKVICSYALLSVNPQLVVHDELKNSVNRLLKEVLKLSKTV